MERSYDVHGLVKVVLSTDLRPELVREIEFQIGAFRSDARRADNALATIRIHPYAAWPAAQQPSGGEPLFFNLTGRGGSAIRDEEGRFAVARDDSGFTLFADYANFLINLYIQLLIVPRGYALVHAAAYESSRGGVNVLAGAGGVGKTAVLGYAVRERGLRHLGDDIVILSRDGRCLAFPRAFVLKSYHREIYAETFERLRLPQSNRYGLKRFLIENAPLMGVAKRLLRRSGFYYAVADRLRPQPFLATVDPETLFGKGSLADSGDIRCIAYIDRVRAGGFAKLDISPDVLVNRLFAVIHYEWKDFLTHLVTLGALDLADLPRYCEQVTGVLRETLSGREIMQLRVPADATPMQLIEFLDRHQFF